MPEQAIGSINDEGPFEGEEHDEVYNEDCLEPGHSGIRARHGYQGEYRCEVICAERREVVELNTQTVGVIVRKSAIRRTESRDEGAHRRNDPRCDITEKAINWRLPCSVCLIFVERGRTGQLEPDITTSCATYGLQTKVAEIAISSSDQDHILCGKVSIADDK